MRPQKIIFLFYLIIFAPLICEPFDEAAAFVELVDLYLLSVLGRVIRRGEGTNYLVNDQGYSPPGDHGNAFYGREVFVPCPWFIIGSNQHC